MTIRNEQELVKNAIGDTVESEILFETEVPLVDFSEQEGIIKTILSIIPEFLTKKAEDQTSLLLNSPIVSYLHTDEQPHFILECNSDIQREKDGEISTLAPSSEFASARIVATDERIMFVLGQSQGDIIKSAYYQDITNIEMESTLLNTSISIETGDVNYQVEDCEPADEISPTVVYARARSDHDGSRTDWGRENFTYEKGNTKSDRFRDLISELDFKKVAKAGVEGASHSKKVGGGKVTAVGFALKAGYEIWRQVSNTDISSTTTPDPDHVAKNIKKWQRAGRNTNNKKIEWLSASIGVAVSVATENSDQETVDLINSVDPDYVVNAIDKGSAVAEDSDFAPVPASSDLDNLPAIELLRQPASELSKTIEKLHKEGLFEEMGNRRDQ